MKRIALVRPPYVPRYNDTDIREDPILTALNGYLDSIVLKVEVDFFDFHLDQHLKAQDLIKKYYSDYVVVVRDLGESYKYSLKLAYELEQYTPSNIYLYGQVAPLRKINDLPKRIIIVNQYEQELASHLGISPNGTNFLNLRYIPYFHKIHLSDWQKKRLKGVIETSRGCPFSCKFCFISVGQSYEKRWQVRNNDQIIADLKHYYSLGISKFTFLDSEFLGMNLRHHQLRKDLLQRIIKELPLIKYMILCRADTLNKFADYDLLKASGLYKVLIGVESLYQPDLDMLNKNSNVNEMKKAILSLIDREIECCLTFLTFHRGTTVDGLEKNINEIEELYQNKNSKYLGMPNFSFNMEIDRSNSNMDQDFLSDKTYLNVLINSRWQLHSKPTFDNQLEPLAEVYRILQYEWVVKKAEILRNVKFMNKADNSKVDAFFGNLGLFCIKQMRYFLNEYKFGRLSMDNLHIAKEKLFKEYSKLYKCLPKDYRMLSTKEHADTLDYQNDIKAVDHGWDNSLSIQI
jgi:radical SAM superfamily enzyme YgiQ (UPF0313 family)